MIIIMWKSNGTEIVVALRIKGRKMENIFLNRLRERNYKGKLESFMKKEIKISDGMYFVYTPNMDEVFSTLDKYPPDNDKIQAFLIKEDDLAEFSIDFGVFPAFRVVYRITALEYGKYHGIRLKFPMFENFFGITEVFFGGKNFVLVTYPGRYVIAFAVEVIGGLIAEEYWPDRIPIFLHDLITGEANVKKYDTM